MDSVDNEDEKKILEGIVKFGNTNKTNNDSPTDVVSFEIATPFNELMSELKKLNTLEFQYLRILLTKLKAFSTLRIYLVK